MSPVLQVFARAPVAGLCKTRLIPALGAAGAAELQRNLMLRTLHMAVEWRELAGGGVVELWCAPDTAHAVFRECGQSLGVRLRAQAQGDLGARMWLALSAALQEGALPVLVGTDCPWLTAPLIEQLHRSLSAHDAAFTPAEDGGYVAVGLARPVPELFAGVEWGRAGVMAQTRERARCWGASIAEVGLLPDIDLPQDLGRLRDDPRLAGLLPSAGLVLSAGAR